MSTTNVSQEEPTTDAVDLAEHYKQAADRYFKILVQRDALIEHLRAENRTLQMRLNQVKSGQTP